MELHLGADPHGLAPSERVADKRGPEERSRARPCSIPGVTAGEPGLLGVREDGRAAAEPGSELTPNGRRGHRAEDQDLGVVAHAIDGHDREAGLVRGQGGLAEGAAD
eukprot:6198612-Alexandrium_andersonii.AAC.1